MRNEIDLLKNYPKTKRDLSKRLAEKSAEDRRIARQFGQAFFDGDRRHGYGGFVYNARFWQPVMPDFQSYYTLTSSSSVLDIGCAKGFMLYDMQQHIPGITVKGIDISPYAIEHALEDVQNNTVEGAEQDSQVQTWENQQGPQGLSELHGYDPTSMHVSDF